MARLIGPDAGSRLVYVLSGSLLRSAAGYTATIYSDAAGAVLADIAAYQPLVPGTPGAVIAGSTLQVDSTSRLPTFWFPLSGQDTLYARVGGVSSPVVAINADYDARIDLLIAGSGVLSVNGDIGPAVVLTAINTPPASIGAAAAVHVHSGTDITTGTVATARLDTGVGATQVSLGNHSHGGSAYRGTWLVGTAYVIGDTVRYENASYGAAAGSTGVTPVTSTKTLTVAPTNLVAADGADYELGVRFTVSDNVRCTGICFFKSSLQTNSPHTLKIYDIGYSTTVPIASAPANDVAGDTGERIAPVIVDLQVGRTYRASIVTGTGSDTGYVTTVADTFPKVVGSVTLAAPFFSSVIGNVTTPTEGTTNFHVYLEVDQSNATWDLMGRFDPVAIGSSRDVVASVAPS